METQAQAKSKVKSVVRCRKIVRTYSQAGAPALNGADLDVARGEWVAIMGPSGSGKSTLMNIIAGVDTPDSGKIWINGANTSEHSRADQARLRRNEIGIVFQAFNLLTDLTASQNIELALRISGTPRKQARIRAQELLESLGLGDLGRRLPSQMSGGQQQRVAIGRALANKPALLLADEPTGALDRTSALEVLEVLREANEMGQTLIVVTHDEAVAKYAARRIYIEDGRVVA